MTLKYLVLKHPLKSLHVHLLLESYLCSKDCPYSSLHVMIPLLSGASMKDNFQMLHFWPNKLLAFLSYKLKHEECLTLLVKVLTCLWHCRLQVENVDWIVIVMKNWPSDPHLNCKKKMDLKKYMKVKTFLVNDNYDLIEEVEYFKKLHWDDDLRLIVWCYMWGWVVLCGVWLGHGTCATIR